jgi:glycosyltransferase involved in cell wall biosynthesis
MLSGKRIAVVVPAFNEERLIGRVIATMPAFVDNIVVVDDASSDRTSERAVDCGDDRVVVIRNATNLGVGAAILAGHRRVLELDADVSVVMAGDAQMDPQHLERLIEPIIGGSAGFAKANRFYSEASTRGMPMHRVLGNVALSFLTKAATGYWHLFDPQNGYTAIRSDVLRRLDLDRINTRYPFENDLLVHLAMLGIPTRDVPIPAVYGDETSTLNPIRVGPQILRVLARGFWRRMLWRNLVLSFSPVALLFLAGLISLAVGFVASCWVLLQTLGDPVATAGTVLLAVGPLMLGGLFLVLSLVLDVIESPGR